MDNFDKNAENIADQVLDTDKWLLSNSLISIHLKNDLFVYGAIAHEHYIKAVKVAIDVQNKLVIYTLFIPKKVLSASKYIEKNITSSNILKLLKILFLNKKHGNLKFDTILNRFIKDRCGPDWSVQVTLENIKNYKEEKNG